MSVTETLNGFRPLSEQDAKTLCAPHLLMAFERALDCSVQLEILGTKEEKVASANAVLLRTEVLRRLEAFRS